MTSLVADVVVPTFHRSALLERCLQALNDQSCLPHEVIVVTAPGDRDTRRVVERLSCGRFRLVERKAPGVIAALREGVAASTSDVVAFTDDDAAPHANWLATLLDHLSQPGVGGAGGRDIISGETSPLTMKVGVFRRHGRVIGNHHLGLGPSRSVDVLKGVNMAFRSEALALPRAGVLRGSGVQMHFEVLVCRWATSQGWKLIYDPAATVDHEGAPRHGADQRERPPPSTIVDTAYNSLVANSLFGSRRLTTPALYEVLVGSRAEPGLARTLVGLLRNEHEVLRRSVPAVGGKLLAVASLLRTDASGAVVSTTELRSQRE